MSFYPPRCAHRQYQHSRHVFYSQYWIQSKDELVPAIFFKVHVWSGEMTQWLRALASLPEVLSSIPSTHMVTYHHLQWGLMPSSGVSEDSYSVLTYIK